MLFSLYISEGTLESNIKFGLPPKTAFFRNPSPLKFEKVAEIEAQTFELLKADGATVIEVEDKAPWVEACQPTIQENTADQAELYQQILNMQYCTPKTLLYC